VVLQGSCGEVDGVLKLLDVSKARGNIGRCNLHVAQQPSWLVPALVS
jgi:hypothetical protein